MKIQLKTAVKAGNSSAVILPRSWLGQEVRIELAEKTKETILLETIELIKNQLETSEIIGIYLVGSYARNEEDKTSDVDILIITTNTSKELIKRGAYSIMIISEKLLNEKLKNDLFPMGPMLSEAEALINSSYLKEINTKVTKNNIKLYLNTTEEKLKLVEKIIKKYKKKNLTDKLSYTLVLRIRTLYLINKLIKKEQYSKKEFLKLIEKLTKGKNSYERYLAVKNNSEEENKSNLEECKILYEYLKNQLSKIKSKFR